MKISIITINFNNKEGLIKTVNSVINQTYKDIEYIIIDGVSTDGSAEYIEEKQKHFDYWVSEPDKGIYNAMNKGIDQATGEYLLFLNSGDYLAADDVVEKFVGFEPVEDIVYGDVYYEDDRVVEHLDRLSLAYMYTDAINHQSIFYSFILFEKYGNYKESYKYLADREHYLRIIFIERVSYKHINLTVSVYNLLGLSNSVELSDVLKAEHEKISLDLFGEHFLSLSKDYYNVSKKYRGLLSSGFVKIALKVSAILKMLRN